MTSKDLISFNTTQQWRKARIKFLEEQKEEINRLSSVLSDMPKGSRIVQDNEAESLTLLLDKINVLIKEIEEETRNQEPELKKQLDKLKPKHGLLLYHYYILGEDIEYIAEEVIHYNKKYVYDLKKEALGEFNKLQEKKG